METRQLVPTMSETSIDRANESMTSILLGLLASYAGPLNPELERLIKGGISQKDGFSLLSELHKTGQGISPFEAQKALPCKSRLEYLANEVNVSEYLKNFPPVACLLQGLVFVQELKMALAPEGPFLITLRWDFQKNCAVTFNKIRENEPWVKPEGVFGLATLEVKT